MKRDPQVDENVAPADEAAEQGDLPGEPGETEETKTGSMEEELETERQRSAEYLEQAQRARAELVNYRRRTEDELTRMQRLAGERILKNFLPVIDDLDRAIDMMGEEERSSSWGQGLLLVQKKIWSTLETEGVAPIESVGQPFDPSIHEAISMQEGANGANTVVQEYQRGFMLGDRVLRPAMVVVGSADDVPADDVQQTDTETAESSEDRE